MKKLFMTLSAVLVATSIAIATPSNTKEKTTEKTTKAVEKKVINTEASTITWKAYKVTGSHEGTINLAFGNLDFNGTVLTGGAFVVDMTTINTTDLEGEYKQKLDGHLHSDDFFGTATHKTASLEITSVKASGKNAYNATANLTIKNITKEVNFTISVYGSKATANLKVDRSQFDVRYGSGSFFDNLGDKTIYDEFDLVVDLQF
ncbi:YceI family protein [Flavobacteriaceae bacterium]|nr:YceI family protein [Flavobacteriaceae bacterium]